MPEGDDPSLERGQPTPFDWFGGRLVRRLQRCVGGIGWSGAKAIDDRSTTRNIEYSYGYFGVLGGVGLEFRLSKVVALNVDFRGFVRGRIDDNRRDYYEFADASGRHTNTSGGGSLNGGLTFYW